MNPTSILPCWWRNQFRAKPRNSGRRTNTVAKPTTAELRKELEKLRRSLRQAESEMTEAAAELQHAIERNDSRPTRKLEQKFNDSVLRFETRHPHITAALSTVSAMLADLGI